MDSGAYTINLFSQQGLKQKYVRNTRTPARRVFVQLKTSLNKKKKHGSPSGTAMFFQKYRRGRFDRADKRRCFPDAAGTRSPRTLRVGTGPALTSGPDNCRRPGRRWRRRRLRWSAAGCACCGSLPPRKCRAFSSGIARPRRNSRIRSDPPSL